MILLLFCPIKILYDFYYCPINWCLFWSILGVDSKEEFDLKPVCRYSWARELVTVSLLSIPPPPSHDLCELSELAFFFLFLRAWRRFAAPQNVHRVYYSCCPSGTSTTAPKQIPLFHQSTLQFLSVRASLFELHSPLEAETESTKNSVSSLFLLLSTHYLDCQKCRFTLVDDIHHPWCTTDRN